METSSKVLLSLLCISVMIIIVATANHFLIKKDYNFALETACDPLEHNCFVRDCDTDECPPNGLEYYRIFEVPAGDFETCLENDCLRECESGAVQCIETVCDEESGGYCSGEPPPTVRVPELDEQEAYVFDELSFDENSTSTKSDHDETIEDSASTTPKTAI